MIDAEDIVKAIIGAIWFIVKFIVYMLFINIIFFYTGYFVLKIITLWKYPPHVMSKKDENIVITTGALMPFVVFAFFFVINNHFF